MRGEPCEFATGNADGVVSGRAFNCEASSIAWPQMNPRGARWESRRSLQKFGREAEGFNGFEGFFAQRVGSHRADEQGIVPESGGVRGKVQGRSAESSRTIEYVPQHFAQNGDWPPVEPSL
jgi:hypothetical protein